VGALFGVMAMRDRKTQASGAGFSEQGFKESLERNLREQSVPAPASREEVFAEIGESRLPPGFEPSTLSPQPSTSP
jgi:hypothetical protein